MSVAQSGPLSFGVSAITPVPVGPLVGNRGVSGGISASLRYAIPGQPWLSIGAAISGLPMSNQVNPVQPVYPSIPPGEFCACAAVADANVVINGNGALVAAFGPRVSVPMGRAHAYATTSAGIARIWATSTVVRPATQDAPPYESAMSTQATNFAWGAGAGFVLPLSSGSSPFALDLGLQYHDLGRAAYMKNFGTYPGVASGDSPIGQTGVVTAYHRTTFLSPSIGVTWHY